MGIPLIPINILEKTAKSASCRMTLFWRIDLLDPINQITAQAA